jgi:hypothetical protein
VDIVDICQKAGRDELEYGFLMDCLSGYASPRAKVTQLIKSGDLIRVKKGLYLVGKKHQKDLICSELWANKIYGPSYISLEYALSFYGLIPEHVFLVTSVTSKRKKNFITPIGNFSYAYLPLKLYSVGYALLELNQRQSALIASPEKALADLFYFRKFDVQLLKEFKDLLFDDLRIDSELLYQLDTDLLFGIFHAGGSKLLLLLIELIKEKKYESSN